LDRTQCRKPELVFVIEFMPMQFEFVILQRMTGVIVAQDFEARPPHPLFYISNIFSLFLWGYPVAKTSLTFN
jgi:hypothetical protein